MSSGAIGTGSAAGGAEAATGDSATTTTSGGSISFDLATSGLLRIEDSTFTDGCAARVGGHVAVGAEVTLEIVRSSFAGGRVVGAGTGPFLLPVAADFGDGEAGRAKREQSVLHRVELIWPADGFEQDHDYLQAPGSWNAPSRSSRQRGRMLLRRAA